MANKSYSVRHAVEHGVGAKLKRYEADSTIDLDDEDAEPLLKCGAIVEPPKPVKADKATDKAADK